MASAPPHPSATTTQPGEGAPLCTDSLSEVAQLQAAVGAASVVLQQLRLRTVVVVCGLAAMVCLLISLSSLIAALQGRGSWPPVLMPLANAFGFLFFFLRLRNATSLHEPTAIAIATLVVVLQAFGVAFNGTLPLPLASALIAFIYCTQSRTPARCFSLVLALLIVGPLLKGQVEPLMATRIVASNIGVILLMEVLMHSIDRLQSTFVAASASLQRLTEILVEDNRQLKHSMEAAHAATHAKSTFLANMSHEIRTPMNGILGMLRLLQNTGLNDRQLDYVQKSHGAAKSLLGLINDILDFSKIEAGKMTLDPQPFSLPKLLGELSDIVSANLQDKALTLRIDTPADLPTCLVGDALRLKQVLINLSGNAIKFTERGEVCISVHPVWQDGHQARLRFAVTDQGIGIAPEQQQRIFEGFSQAESSTTRRFGGTGLGLSISRRLVELMGGEMQLHSVPGEGSCFSFELPLTLASADAASALQEASPRTAGLPRAPLAGLRLLLVEDNELNQQVALELLREMGADVALARHGREALEMLCSQPSLCDVVLSDVHMPEMDGYTLTRLIRQSPELQRLPVVAMTANAMPADRERCLQAGMNEHVSKPFEIEHLVRVLLSLHDPSQPASAAEHPPPEAPAPMASASPPPPPATSAPAEADARFVRVLIPQDLCAQAMQHGIDAQTGMDRFMGKVGLYRRMVQSFNTSSATLPERLQAQLNEGRLDEALITLHSLKGLAATLAADRMAARAGEGEEMLRAGQAPDAAWLLQFNSQLSETCQQLELLGEGMADLRPG